MPTWLQALLASLGIFAVVVMVFGGLMWLGLKHPMVK
jgi:hypothetical protein